MSKKRKSQNSLLAVKLGILILGVAVVSGCDQWNTLKNYFSPKKKKPEVVQPSVPSPPPVSPSPVTSAATDSGSRPASASVAVKSPPMDPSRVLARAGDWVLTREEFEARQEALKQLAPDYRPDDEQQNRLIIEELARQHLLVRDAEQTGLADKLEIVRAVEDFRRSLIVREKINQLTQNIKVMPEEVKAYYEENKAAFIEPVQWRVREIVVDDEEEAKQILVQLYQGTKSFEDMVKEKSKAKSAWNKGDLGFLEKFPFPKMGSVVAALELGDVSGVFKGPDGYYIVKLEEKKGGEAVPFDKVKDDIEQGLLLLKQQEVISSYIAELEKKTKIDINEDLIKAMSKGKGGAS